MSVYERGLIEWANHMQDDDVHSEAMKLLLEGT
jgi:hypothetical protein